MGEAIARERRDSLAPGLVVAMPQLLDPNFQKAVVFVLRSSDDGAFGLIINRPSNISVRDLCRGQDLEYRGPEQLRVMIGGPVETESHLLVLHGDQRVFAPGSDQEIEVADGLFLVTAREGLERLASRGTARIRCFAGYSGWGPGQLEGELQLGAWVPLAPNTELMFDGDPDAVWDKSLRHAGIDPISLVPGGAPS